MTIEVLLQSISERLDTLIALYTEAPAQEAPASVAPAETPKRGRGRPRKGDTTVNNGTVSVQPVKEPTRDDVRAALEAMRQRLKVAKMAEGVDMPEAQAHGTQRVLAWLNETCGTKTLAGLTEDKFGVVIRAAKTAK